MTATDAYRILHSPAAQQILEAMVDGQISVPEGIARLAALAA